MDEPDPTGLVLVEAEEVALLDHSSSAAAEATAAADSSNNTSSLRNDDEEQREYYSEDEYVNGESSYHSYESDYADYSSDAEEPFSSPHSSMYSIVDGTHLTQPAPNETAKALSLQAERATTSSARRILSDMHKVMLTPNLPFEVEQKDEDRMDQWMVRLKNFDEESDLWKDLKVIGMDCVELQMDFPKDYPFAPPFVQVVKPRFARQTGFIINGAICMELLSPEGWRPINSVESVIVSIQSHIVIGRGRVEVVKALGDERRNELLKNILQEEEEAEERNTTCDDSLSGAAVTVAGDDNSTSNYCDEESGWESPPKRKKSEVFLKKTKDENLLPKLKGGKYSVHEAKAGFNHIVRFHSEHGWYNEYVKRG